VPEERTEGERHVPGQGGSKRVVFECGEGEDWAGGEIRHEREAQKKVRGEGEVDGQRVTVGSKLGTEAYHRRYWGGRFPEPIKRPRIYEGRWTARIKKGTTLQRHNEKVGKNYPLGKRGERLELLEKGKKN